MCRRYRTTRRSILIGCRTYTVRVNMDSDKEELSLERGFNVYDIYAMAIHWTQIRRTRDPR